LKKADSKRKIVALYFYSLVRSGGAERMICELANSLSEKGFLVYLISLDKSNDQAYFFISSSVTWIKLDYRQGYFDKLRRLLRLFKILKRLNVQAIIGFVISGDATVLTAARLANIKIIAAERNAPSIYQLYYSKLRRNINFFLLNIFADCITVQQPDFCLGYPISIRSRITFIPNIVRRPDSFCVPDKKNSFGRFILLYVGRLENSQKQIDILINAFFRIFKQHIEWDLHIIGDGPDRDYLQKLISDYGMNSRALIFPSTRDIYKIYSQANLYVMPSRWEGFPNALAEALSHGVPAVGFSRAMGVAELIGSSSGWLAEGLEDLESLVYSLSNAMHDHNGRRIRGQYAAINMERFQKIDTINMWEQVLS